MLSTQRRTFDAAWDQGTLDFIRQCSPGAVQSPLRLRLRQFGAAHARNNCRNARAHRALLNMAQPLSCARQLQTRASIARAKIRHLLRDNPIGRRNLEAAQSK